MPGQKPILVISISLFLILSGCQTRSGTSAGQAAAQQLLAQEADVVQGSFLILRTGQANIVSVEGFDSDGTLVYPSGAS